MFRSIFCLFLSLLISAAIEAPAFAEDVKPAGETQAEIMEKIRHSNATLKKTPEWLKEAYSGVKIKKLADIKEADYESYGRYVFGGNAYFIVHPGFHVFFETKSVRPANGIIGDYPNENLFERFAAGVDPSYGPHAVLKEQERILRDFVEFLSYKKRLAILVLPGNYKSHLSAGYNPGMDEYARYINEMTNMSESVVYVESEEWENGYLFREDIDRLAEFLKAAGVKNVLMGGGYLGKCVDNTYASVRKIFLHESVFFVPEVLAISPNDMAADASQLLDERGRIKFGSIRKYLRIGSSTGEAPRFKRLTSFRAYPRSPDAQDSTEK